MKTYTKDELRDLFGLEQDDFDTVVDKMPPRRGMPTVFKLKKPLDVGERAKAKYLIHILGRGWAFFPSIASAKLWFQEQQWWAAA